MTAPLHCVVCGRSGNSEDGIEYGGPCQEPCIGIVGANPDLIGEAATNPLVAARRLIQLLRDYGEAKFGDEWWPGEPYAWLDEHDAVELVALIDIVDNYREETR